MPIKTYVDLIARETETGEVLTAEPFQSLSEILMIIGGLLVQIGKKTNNKAGLDGVHIKI